MGGYLRTRLVEIYKYNKYKYSGLYIFIKINGIIFMNDLRRNNRG